MSAPIPIPFIEILIGYIGAAATKSFIIGLNIPGTAGFFVPLDIAHPIWMMGFLIPTCITFSLFGFIIGLWADNFEKLQPTTLVEHVSKAVMDKIQHCAYSRYM